MTNKASMDSLTWPWVTMRQLEKFWLPEFFGQKGKDNITAIIRNIDDLAHTNKWNDTITYANVANTLKGFARDWLFATIEM